MNTSSSSRATKISHTQLEPAGTQPEPASTQPEPASTEPEPAGTQREPTDTQPVSTEPQLAGKKSASPDPAGQILNAHGGISDSGELPRQQQQ